MSSGESTGMEWPSLCCDSPTPPHPTANLPLQPQPNGSHLETQRVRLILISLASGGITVYLRPLFLISDGFQTAAKSK